MLAVTALGAVTEPASAGVVEPAATTAALKVLSLQANDLAYDPGSARLYASIPTGVADYGDSVLPIDPGSASFDAPISMGTAPNQLARTADGSYLYVGLDDVGAVRLLDLATGVPGPQFSLGSDPYYGAFRADDIKVVPGSATSIAVALRNKGYSPRHMGVAVYDNGVARPTKTATHTGSNTIVFGADAAHLYGFNTESTEVGFRRMTVSASGVVVDDVTGLGSGWQADPAYADGFVYEPHGKVIDVSTPAVVATFPGLTDYAMAVVIDVPGNRAYFAERADFTTVSWQIHEYDLTTRQSTAIYPLRGVKGHLVKSFVATGERRLALATDGGTIALADLDESWVDDPTGEFTPVTPTRILDTRTALGGRPGRVGAGERFDVQITGARGVVPATGVGAVVLNVTVTEPTMASYLTVWPKSSGGPPTISNLNYVAGQTVPNLVTVRVGDQGKVSVYNNLGTVHVIFDVVGYYSDVTGSLGSRFHAVPPTRLFDTRNNLGGVGRSRVGATGHVWFDVHGKGGVPSSTTVTAIVLNVTVTEPSAASYLTVYPDGNGPPLASNLNFVPGQTVPNLVTVQVPPSGVVAFYNNAGATHVLADVVGYYDTDRTTEAGRFVAASVPGRVLDTRIAPGPIPPGSGIALSWNPVAGLDPTWVGAWVLNATVTAPTAAGFLTAFPYPGAGVPDSSNLNFVPGDTVPNLVVVKASTQKAGVAFFNSAGYTHLVVDVFGFFTSAAAPSPLLAGTAAAEADTQAAGDVPTPVAERIAGP